MENVSSGQNVSPEQEVKFDKFAEELLEEIKAKNITIDPVVWSVLNHVLGNRIYALELTIGDFSSAPVWLLKVTSFFMAVLYKASGGRGRAFPISHYLDRIQYNVTLMDVFIKRLRAATEKKSGF